MADGEPGVGDLLGVGGWVGGKRQISLSSTQIFLSSFFFKEAEWQTASQVLSGYLGGGWVGGWVGGADVLTLSEMRAMFSFTGSGTLPKAASVALMGREGGSFASTSEGGDKALSQGELATIVASNGASSKDTVVVEGLPRVTREEEEEGRPSAPPLVLLNASAAAASLLLPPVAVKAPNKELSVPWSSSRKVWAETGSSSSVESVAWRRTHPGAGLLLLLPDSHRGWEEEVVVGCGRRWRRAVAGEEEGSTKPCTVGRPQLRVETQRAAAAAAAAAMTRDEAPVLVVGILRFMRRGPGAAVAAWGGGGEVEEGVIIFFFGRGRGTKVPRHLAALAKVRGEGWRRGDKRRRHQERWLWGWVGWMKRGELGLEGVSVCQGG